ncbi:MAG: site-2 protease family protein [Chloroflexota bacterium]
MNGFRVGRLFGINIHVDWSWIAILALVSWSLSATFEQVHPEWSYGVHWGMAILAAFLFFVSILAHELAHSLAALARGVPVHSIMLFMFGGVSNLEKEPASPAEEMVITIVGPLTSLFLGAVGLVIGAGSLGVDNALVNSSALLSRLQPLNTILAWLGSVNMMVGLFNLIPAFPLDGGRIVRSLIWAVSNDVCNATRWASWLGQGIAWSMIIAGAIMMFGVEVPFFGSGLFSGVWLVFIGWFLNNAATSGYRQAVIQDVLTDLPVRSVMQTQIPVVSSEVSVDELVNRQFAQTEEHAMLVTEGEEVVGMVARNDVAKSTQHEWQSTPVGDIMTPVSDLVHVTPDQDVAEAFDRLQRLDLRQIPVILNNRIVGLLRRKDVVRWLQLRSDFGSS